MIIDAHAHLFESLDVYHKPWLDGIKAHFFSKLEPKEFDSWLSALDGKVETLIKDMDEAGVDKAIALPSGCALAYGEEMPRISIWRSVEYVAEAQKRYPTRIIGFARVDPLRKDSVELLTKAVKEWGLKGVKIVPPVPLTDEAVQPLMNKIDEFGLIVLSHTGVNPPPYPSRLGDPMVLDTLAARFPRIRFIAAHYAKGFEEFLTALLFQRRGRIYADLSMWQEECASSRWWFTLKMRNLMDRIPHSILMGSDWPFIRKSHPLSYKDWFAAIRNLKIPDLLGQLDWGMKDFSPEEKDWILGRNAQSLLGL